MTISRKQQICLDETPYYHCISRCVRRAFLCGEDAYTGRSYEHRREWIVEKLKQLDEVFFISICAYPLIGGYLNGISVNALGRDTSWDLGSPDWLLPWRGHFVSH